MPEQSIHDIPAKDREQMLSVMLHSPAFALMCDKWDEHVTNDVEKKIFDLATSDQETRELKRVREQLTKTRHPRKIVEAMLRTTHSETITK